MTDILGSLFGQPPPIDWEAKRMQDEQRGRYFGEFHGMRVVADTRVAPEEIAFSYDGGRTLRYRISLSTFTGRETPNLPPPPAA